MRDRRKHAFLFNYQGLVYDIQQNFSEEALDDRFG